jgi:hypothetical protein
MSLTVQANLEKPPSRRFFLFKKIIDINAN